MDREQIVDLCRDALLAAGVDVPTAQVLADATAEAELVGNRAVGVAHLFDYLDGFREGRIVRDARPVVRHPARAVLDVDAAGGIAQTAFARVLDDLQTATREAGIATLWIRNSFTCGELGYYPRRLAQQGLLAVAAANSPALMSLGGAPASVLGTNPLAYAIPRPGRVPVVVDQASSATAFVNIKRAAAAGEYIPVGWSLGPDGKPTEDAATALRGTLLPFGSHRGGNIALLVEVLATLSGASFSLDAAPFDSGADSPGIGVFVLSIAPALFPDSLRRLSDLFERLRDDHQVRLPALDLTAMPNAVDLAAEDVRRLREAAGVAPQT